MLLWGCIFMPKNYIQVVIDENVQEKAVLAMEGGHKRFGRCGLEYLNNIDYSLCAGNNSQKRHYVKHMMPFYSYWGIAKDTIVICGLYGIEGKIGFTVHVIAGKAKVYCSIRSSSIGQFSYTKEGDMKIRLDIPAKSAKVILSKIPRDLPTDIVYGFVEFETIDFYERQYENEEKRPNLRNRVRVAMKAYFKASGCDSIDHR